MREDLIAAAVQRALLQSAEVRILHPRDDEEDGPLDAYGGIGAVLRF
jgi:peptide subunit release factor 1 (eRF1)